MIGLDALDDGARRRCFRVLCHLAGCDGTIATAERTMLDEWRDAMHLRPDEAQQLEAEGLAGEALARVESEAEREFLLRYMVQIVAGDGVLAQEEGERLQSIAERVGLDPERVKAKVLDRLMGPPR